MWSLASSWDQVGSRLKVIYIWRPNGFSLITDACISQDNRMGTFDIPPERPHDDVCEGGSLNMSDFAFVSISSRFAFLLYPYSCRGGLLENGQLFNGVNDSSVLCSELAVPREPIRREERAHLNKVGMAEKSITRCTKTLIFIFSDGTRISSNILKHS